MKTGARLAVLILVTCAAWSFAEQRLPSSGPPQPTTALEALERYIEGHYPGLADAGRKRAWVRFIGAGAAAAGSVTLALVPAMRGWSPGGDEDSTLIFIGILGGCHGLAISPLMGMGLGELLFPPVDLRAEYGALLDLPGPEREQRARLLCGRIAEQETRRGVAQLVLMAGFSACSIGAYYLGESQIGRTSAADDVGRIYALCLSGAALYVALLLPGSILGADIARLRDWGKQ